MTRPVAPASWFERLSLLGGAALGGLLADTAGGAPAGAVGGILGALVVAVGLGLSRRTWPAPLRWTAALAAWFLGFAALWIGAGFVAAVIGLAGARR